MQTLLPCRIVVIAHQGDQGSTPLPTSSQKAYLERERRNHFPLLANKARARHANMESAQPSLSHSGPEETQHAPWQSGSIAPTSSWPLVAPAVLACMMYRQRLVSRAVSCFSVFACSVKRSSIHHPLARARRLVTFSWRIATTSAPESLCILQKCQKRFCYTLEQLQ